MRIRSIKPEFWDSESVGRLSRDARLLFVGLWSFADDSGNFRGHSRKIANALFAYDEDAVRCIDAWLDELVSEGMIYFYEVDGDLYGAIRKWSAHQKIDKPGKPRVPDSRDRRELSRDRRELSPQEQGTGNREQVTANSDHELSRDRRELSGDRIEGLDVAVAVAESDDFLEDRPHDHPPIQMRPLPPVSSVHDFLRDALHAFRNGNTMAEWESLWRLCEHELALHPSDDWPTSYHLMMAGYHAALDAKKQDEPGRRKHLVFPGDVRAMIHTEADKQMESHDG